MKKFDQILVDYLPSSELLKVLFDQPRMTPQNLEAKTRLALEAKITDTDDALLAEICRRAIYGKNPAVFSYGREDILAVCSPATWRYYQHFKKNANSNTRLDVFASDAEQLLRLRRDFPQLKWFFDRIKPDQCFGTTAGRISHAYIWLNKEILQKEKDPTKLLQHQMIHVWSYLINTQSGNNFAVHRPEASIDPGQLTVGDISFLYANFQNEWEKHAEQMTNLYNYIIGSDGMEFQSQVNDICDAFQRAFFEFGQGTQDIPARLERFLICLRTEAPDVNVMSILGEHGIDTESLYQLKFCFGNVFKTCLLHAFGRDRIKDKLWYLDQAIKEHFQDVLKEQK